MATFTFRSARATGSVRALAGGVLVATTALLGVPAVLSGAAAAAAAVPTSSTISSVVFEGTAANPTIVVKGSGFKSTPPTADPAAHPNGQNGCPAFSANRPTAIANDGYDYGPGNLYIQDTTANWRAGNYVAGSETDCIGIRIIKWTPRQLTLKLGTAYNHPLLERGFRFIFTTGDAIVIDVLARTKSVVY